MLVLMRVVFGSCSGEAVEFCQLNDHDDTFFFFKPQFLGYLSLIILDGLYWSHTEEIVDMYT